MKKIKIIHLLIASVAILILQAFASGYFSNHIGTDDQSVDIIQEIAPGYTPWANHLVEFKSDMMEPVLFAIQALLGLSIIMYYILKHQKKNI